MADITTIRTPLTTATLDVTDKLRDCLAVAEAEPQQSVAIVMVGEDGQITTAWAFASQLALKGALVHALARIE